MTSLGNSHDNAVKKLTNSYIPDLKSQEESIVPSYIEQSSGFAVADREMKQRVQKNRMVHEVILSQCQAVSKGIAVTVMMAHIAMMKMPLV